MIASIILIARRGGPRTAQAAVARTKGEGRMLAQTSTEVKNGRVELENYGREPARLTTVSERK